MNEFVIGVQWIRPRRTCHCKNTRDSAALAFDTGGAAYTKKGPGRRASSRDTHSHIKTSTTRCVLFFFNSSSLREQTKHWLQLKPNIKLSLKSEALDNRLTCADPP